MQNITKRMEREIPKAMRLYRKTKKKNKDKSKQTKATTVNEIEYV